MTSYKTISKAVRSEINLSGTPYPIVITGDDKSPAIAGESYYWTTPSGKTIVRYPNAYGYRTLYHASTRRIEVGRDWLFARGLVTVPVARG
jgi:hypothetical protein